MNKKKSNVVISWAIVMVMLLFNFVPISSVYAAEINKDVLIDLKATITQDGANIPEDGNLDSTKPIRVDISFGVPVKGDDPTPDNPVKKGDTVKFNISKAFKLTTPTTVGLKMGGVLVGTATFETDSITKMVTASVTFNGDEKVFDGTLNTVKGEFGAEFEYDTSGDSGAEGDHNVTILEKTYTVTVPPKQTDYSVTKAGTANLTEASISWTVTLGGIKDGKAIDLSGHHFYDDLKEVGTYIDNSFKVEGLIISPAISGTGILYKFPEGSTSPKVVTFETKISEDNYYKNTEQRVKNIAQLQSSESAILKDGSFEVKFTPKWIEKAGKASQGAIGVYNPKDRTITWTITANHYGATLKNVIITDALPTDLTHVSSKWQKWDGLNWETATPITPSAINEYEIGDIDSKILLTIVSKVPDESYTTGITTYTNSANIRWGSMTGPGIGSGGVGVGIGYNAITKSGKADNENQKITWTVEVDTWEQSIPDLKVYDLLVYGDSIDLPNVTGISSGISHTDLTPQYGQKYIDSSFAATPGSVKVNVIPIYKEGKRVADLLEITGLSTDVKNSFKFDTQVLNPNIFAGNKDSTVYNTATLFSANAKLNHATANVSYTNRMLSKEMLKREEINKAILDPTSIDSNNSTKKASEGFDYVDKSVIFRLSVNADGIDLTNTINAALESLGTATLTDTLPEGWEFVDIKTDSKYLIFEGIKGTDSLKTSGKALDTVEGLTANFLPMDSSTSFGAIAKFEFKKLDKPYVILVKAKPNEDTVKGYFDRNKTTTVKNNVNLKTKNWTPGISQDREVSITSQILGKTANPPKDGELRWVVEYKPYELDHLGSNLEIKDELPLGIDLRMDAKGKIIIDKNISVHEMILKTDGTYIEGGLVTLELGKNIHYDNSKRILTFDIPDEKTAYKFSYITDITGAIGKITNKASLLGSGSEIEDTIIPYSITAADGSASFKINGWISITKTDAEGKFLSGAAFTLFALDGTTVIREGVTDKNGILTLKVIPDGEYILKETKAPDGFSPTGSIHSLVVTTEGLNVTASIDGKTGTESNKITLKNFKDGTTGKLTINKTVAGNAGDTTKKFDFTVTFDGAGKSYTYIGHGIPDGLIKSGDTISLAHNQSITIVGLPKDAKYNVVEANYTGQGYNTASVDAMGTIEADIVHGASFTNTRNVSSPGTGNLTISKAVVGSDADKEKKFDFIVTLNGAAGSYSYTGNGLPSGKIKSGDTISLANGQNITITGLPIGTKYQVTEDKDSAQGYSVKSVGTSGNISYSKDSTASFTNTKSPESTPGEDPPVDVDGDVPGGGDVVIPGNELPKTGGMSKANIFFVGGLLILLGIMLRRKTAE